MKPVYNYDADENLTTHRDLFAFAKQILRQYRHENAFLF